MTSAIQYAPWSSDIELAFYSALASIKIDHDKLNDSARKCLGLYELRPQDQPARSARMQIHGSALTTDEVPAGYYRAEGIFKNVNTWEEYKTLDRAAVIDRAGRTIWDAINDGTIFSCPSLLSSFTTICYADLKKYKYTYHFAFPAIHSDPTWKLAQDDETSVSKLSSKETQGLVDTVQTWKYRVDTRQHGFFLAKRLRGLMEIRKHDEDTEKDEEGRDLPPPTPDTPGLNELGYIWAVGSLSSYENGFFDGVEAEDRFICFVDPSNYPINPGWPLRNLLVLMRKRWGLTEAQILCYRDIHARRDQPNSLILHLKTAPAKAEGDASTGETRSPTSKPAFSSPGSPRMPKITGWERNESGKLNSKTQDLAMYMDPTKLADQAVDLNLKLIKWRIAPNIDLDTIKNTSCLLLGAGTLGSYVSRNLLGWGVRKVTFVDYGNVSFSNPVRQPLFDFKDCLQGGVKKAYRAAEALMEIYPGVDTEGHVLSVPMAGHPVTDEEKTKSEFEKLKTMIDQHDVIFLLMDTRESRWLPTVMGKAAGKIVVNAALGFDTYVVMRHGLEPQSDKEEELGCYFCNDVVAPQDSMKDQTLDQQCTVTRPGIAAIASALLVELLISILQHPLRGHAPASGPSPTTSGSESAPSEQSSLGAKEYQHPLGILPHQIRGFLSTFSNLCIKGKAYDCCSACSRPVLDAYRKDGWDFVKRALNEPGWVEELSGLKEVQRKAEAALGEVDWDESDEGEGGEIGEDGELL